jgi:hypothetical protein
MDYLRRPLFKPKLRHILLGQNRSQPSRIANERAGKPLQPTGALHYGSGPGPSMLHMLFVFLGSVNTCRLYKLILPDQSQAILQLKISLFEIA